MGLGKHELVLVSGEVWQRTRQRLDGLTDQEYFWEPAPGCWSIRPTADGTMRADRARPTPEPAPFTTIAWRMWHLIDMYGEDRAPRWLDVPPQGIAVGPDDPDATPPANAAEALATLERAHDRWEAHLALVTDEQLAAPIGPIGGEYGDRARASYVLHMLDEFIHHAAEVSLLRDLWRWQHPLDPDPQRHRAIVGDVSLAAEVDGGSEASPLLALAATYGRWPLVREMVDRGVDPNTGGRTPLHVAALDGAAGLCRLLVDHGADPTVRDPDFQAPPAEWARVGDHHDLAAWLDALTADI